MKDERKARIYIASFALLLLFFGALTLLLPQKETSAFERRKLARMPQLTLSRVLSGEYYQSFEKFAPDHFPLRDSFRAIASASRLYVFRQADTHGVFLHDGSIHKLEYPEKDGSVEKTASVLNSVIGRFPESANVYLAVIPDKNYYLPEDAGYPRLPYAAMLERIRTAVPNAAWIDLTDTLSPDSYYRTDTHWRQEALGPVCDRLFEAMGVPVKFSDTAYEAREFSPFSGVLAGQLALPAQDETITYLTNGALEEALVENSEMNSNPPVYDLSRTAGMDPYDLFLSGASAFVRVTNEAAVTDRALVIFRDSYGSSIAPLLLSGYRTVTLVDLRYLSSAYLDQFLAFGDQDVLILLSTLLWNGGGVLK